MVKEIDLDDVNLYLESTYSPKIRIITVNGHDVGPIAKFYEKHYVGEPVPDDVDFKSYNLYDQYMFYKNTPYERKLMIKSTTSKRDPNSVKIGEKINLDTQTLFKASTYDPEVLVALVDDQITRIIKGDWENLKKQGIDPVSFPSERIRLYDYYIQFHNMSRNERENLFKSEVEKMDILETLKTYPVYHFFNEIDDVDIIKYVDDDEDKLVLLKLYGKNSPTEKTFSRPLEVFSEDDAENLLNELLDYYDKNVPQKFKDKHLSTIAFDGNMAYFLYNKR